MKELSKLTEKQKRFCDFYIECGNGTEAARRAGYSGKNCDRIASENLRKLDVSNYIKSKIDKKDNDRIASQNEVLEYFTRLMRGEENDELVLVDPKFGVIREEQRVNSNIRLSAAKELAKRYGLDKKYNFDERKLKIIEKQAQELDDDICYEVDDSDEED